MRRRRRARGTWFPVLGTAPPGEPPIGAENNSNARSAVNIIRGDGGISHTIFPLTFDTPQEPDTTIVNQSTPLSDLLGNEYILERIVGNCWVWMFQRNNTVPGDVTPGGVYCAVAFFTARSEDEAIDNDSPIGSQVAAASLANYAPLNAQNIREPWIFRRTWVLGNGLVASGINNSDQSICFPPSNALWAPSGLAGPFFDSRSKRRVQQDERLWCVFATRSFPLNSESDGQQSLDQAGMLLDYRIYGSLRKAHNRSSF